MRRVPALLVLIVGLLSVNVLHAEGPFYRDGKHAAAELRTINGLSVLIVQGTPEEIGEQMAVLTGDQIKKMLDFPRELVQKQKLGALWPILVAMGKSLEPNFPPDHRRELEAGIKKLGVNRDLAIFGNTFPDVSKAAGCSSLIVGRERSATGGPLFGRNLDYPTLGRLQDYTLVTIYRPKGKKAFASIGFPGLIGCLSGINEDGLALAVHEVRATKDKSAKLDSTGIPYTLAFRRLLEECSTVDEAEKLLRSMKRTTMLNLGVCDPKGGAIFELTSKNLVVRPPSEDICTCSNHFCSDELSVGLKCKRLDALDGSRSLKEKVDLKEMARHLHLANQGAATLQTMVFEPATLKLHLATGKCPSSAQPMKELDLKPLLRP